MKHLAAMARKKRVPGWHAMRKDELVQALLKLARLEAAKRPGGAYSRSRPGKPSASQNGNGSHRGNGTAVPSPPKKARTPAMERRLQDIKR